MPSRHAVIFGYKVPAPSSPGGPSSAVQFNNAGAFGGSLDFEWDGTKVNLISTDSGTGAGNDGQLIDLFNSAGATTHAQIQKHADNSFWIRNDTALTPADGYFGWDANGNAFLWAGSSGPQLEFYTGASVTPFGAGSAVLVLFDTGTGPHVFAVNNAGSGHSGYVSLDPYNCSITFGGDTSGSATLGVKAVAGTPNAMYLPTATGTAGYVLTTDGANPQNLSWSQVSSAAITGQIPISQVGSAGLSASSPVAIAASGAISFSHTPSFTSLTLGISGSTSGVLTLEGSTSGGATITAPAVAGTSTNPIVFSNTITLPVGADATPAINFSGSTNTGFGINGGGLILIIGGTGRLSVFSSVVQVGSAGVYSFTNGSSSDAGSPDTGISRTSAGVMAVGNGTSGDASGTLNASAYQAGGTAGVTAGSFSAITAITSKAGIVTQLTGTSDERLKNSVPYLGGLEKILAISPVSYYWNENGSKFTGLPVDVEYVGFLAQNVQKAIPEAITGIEGKEGYLSFDDRPIVAALVNAVKELNLRIQKLEKEGSGR